MPPEVSRLGITGFREVLAKNRNFLQQVVDSILLKMV